MINQRFGMLTVVEQSEPMSGKSAWKCKCDCGNEKIVRQQSLKRGQSKSCGCKVYGASELSPGSIFNYWTILKRDGKIREEKAYLCQCRCGKQERLPSSNLTEERSKSCGCRPADTEHDLTGQTFGRLEVLEKAPNIQTKTAWLCKCKCGQEKAIKTQQLLEGKAQSCGCQINYNRVNHTGESFGRLLVISKFEKENNNWHYLCECECGNETVVKGNSLASGQTKSCGCLQREEFGKSSAARSGPLNPAWRGGNSLDDPRKTKEYKHWRRQILSTGKCLCCGDTKSLQAHHLYAVAAYPDKIFDPANGCCLCATCHILFHMEYGSGDNTPEQINQFIVKSLNP